jgi:predicted Zn-dependent protease
MSKDDVAHWEKAVALLDALVYDEPPAWNYPLRESLGAALVREGRAAEAEKVFREGLKRSPRNAWMIFGVMEAMKAQGKTEGMAELQHELDAAWSKADVKLALSGM